MVELFLALCKIGRNLFFKNRGQTNIGRETSLFAVNLKFYVVDNFLLFVVLLTANIHNNLHYGGITPETTEI